MRRSGQRKGVTRCRHPARNTSALHQLCVTWPSSHVLCLRTGVPQRGADPMGGRKWVETSRCPIPECSAQEGHCGYHFPLRTVLPLETSVRWRPTGNFPKSIVGLVCIGICLPGARKNFFFQTNERPICGLTTVLSTEGSRFPSYRQRINNAVFCFCFCSVLLRACACLRVHGRVCACVCSSASLLC